jgi:hypothetical protein
MVDTDLQKFVAAMQRRDTLDRAEKAAAQETALRREGEQRWREKYQQMKQVIANMMNAQGASVFTFLTAIMAEILINLFRTIKELREEIRPQPARRAYEEMLAARRQVTRRGRDRRASRPRRFAFGCCGSRYFLAR